MPKELWDDKRVERYIRMYGDPRTKKGSQSQLCKDASVFIKPYSVLDVGCGIGHLVPFARSPGEGFGERVGMAYTGVDKSMHMLAKAKKFFPQELFLHADATDFDLGTKYDTVISISLLLHLDEEQAMKALACMWRHIAPNGKLILGMETMGDRVDKRSDGLIIRNQPVLKLVDMLRTVAGEEKVNVSWSHQKVVYQTVSEVIYSGESPHKIVNHQPIARTTIFVMEKA